MENLNDIFDLEPIEKEKSNNNLTIIKSNEINPSAIDPVDSALIPDFNTSRDNIDAIIAMGRQALEQVLEIAQEGQHPRFYETAAILIKNLSDANKDYLDVHEKISRIRKNNAEVNGGSTPSIQIKNAVFTGTASDLLKQVNPRESKPKVIDVT